MGKISEVEIGGHLYRYEYKDGKTIYLGPVGDGPTLTEQEFNLTMFLSGVPTVIINTKKGVVQMTPEPWDKTSYKIELESNVLTPKDIYKMFKRNRNVKRVSAEKDLGKEIFRVGDVGEVTWFFGNRFYYGWGSTPAMFVKKEDWPAIATYIDDEMRW